MTQQLKFSKRRRAQKAQTQAAAHEVNPSELEDTGHAEVRASDTPSAPGRDVIELDTGLPPKKKRGDKLSLEDF